MMRMQCWATRAGLLPALAVAAAICAPGAALGLEPTEQARRCAPWIESASVAFTGLNPAIEGVRPISEFASGQIVEIDPRTTTEEKGKAWVKALQALGARVSIYLVGGHCDLGEDCASLPKAVRLDTTGSWNWDKSERRIVDITHPAVLGRLARGIEGGWRIGANYIRIDNIHHPAGAAFPRTEAQMLTLIELMIGIEDRLRREGAIPADRVTGFVAHNNLVVWEKLIMGGRIARPPAFLTSERTAQLGPTKTTGPEQRKGFDADRRMRDGKLVPSEIADVEAGRRLARRFHIPYSVVEFRRSHDLARKGAEYTLPQAYVDALAALPGITEVIVMPSESHYIGRAEVHPGKGPSRLPARADFPLPPMHVITGKGCEPPP